MREEPIRKMLPKNLQERAQKYVSDEEFNALLDDQVQMTEDEVDRQEGKPMVPKLYLYSLKDEDGRRDLAICILADDFLSKGAPVNKHEFMASVGKRFADKQYTEPKEERMQVAAAFMVSEAWTRNFSDEEMKERDKSGKWIEDYEDKKEVIVVQGSTIDLRPNIAILPFHRTKGNELIMLSKQIKKSYFKPTDETSRNILLESFFAGYALSVATNSMKK